MNDVCETTRPLFVLAFLAPFFARDSSSHTQRGQDEQRRHGIPKGKDKDKSFA
jgi:hypothetical protein